MKRVSLALAALSLAAFFTLPAIAAEPQSPPAAGAKGQKMDRMKMMKEELGLTDAQIEKLRPIIREEGQAMAAVRNDSSLDEQAQRAKMRDIRQAHAAKIRAVLTPDQQAKFDSMRQGGPGAKGDGKKGKKANQTR